MFENRKRERVMRAPEDGRGAGRNEDIVDVEATIDPESGQEVYRPVEHVVRALPAPENASESPEAVTATVFRERPKGKGAEAKAYLKDLAEAARSVGAGPESVQDAYEFGAALAKYAEIRTRSDASHALLGAVVDLDARDVPAFRARIGVLEEALTQKGYLRAEESGSEPKTKSAESKKTESSSEGPKQKERSGAPKPSDRMTEEELLKGLEGLAPAPGADYKRPDGLPDGWTETLERRNGAILRSMTDGTNIIRRDATNEDRERLAWTLPDIKPEERNAPLKESAPKEPRDNQGGETDEDELATRQARISAESKRKKNEKRKNKRESTANSASNEASENRDERLQMRAEEFNTRGRADMDRAADIFVDIRDSLAPEDVDAFMQKVRDLGWDINGDVHSKDGGESDSRPYVELVPLGNTEKKLTEALGQPAGHVEGIPFWVLEDGDGVMLSPGGDEGAPVPQRIGEEGIRRIKNSVYQYRDGAFHKTTEAEAKKSLRRIHTQRGQKEKAPEMAKGSQDASKSDAPDRPVESKDDAEKPRSLDEAKRIFFRSHNKEKKKTGVAFRDAVKGLSDKNRKNLIDFVTDTTDTPRAILERIHADVEHEHKQKEEQREEKTRERIRTMMRGAAKPEKSTETEAVSEGELRSRIQDLIRKNSEA